MRAAIRVALAGVLTATTLTTLTATSALAVDVDYSSIKINEVNSNLAPNDWIELVNTGDVEVDLSGVVVKDNDDTRVDVLAAGTTIPAGGHLVLDNGAEFSFGLGQGDSARIFTPGGTQIDGFTWPANTHAITNGRCPDGTGEFVAGLEPTPGEANDCPLPKDVVKVNEIYSEGGDFIELTNVGPSAVDVSGWVLGDSSAKRFLVPAGSVLPADGFLSFLVDDTTNPLGGFGLGNGDAARVLLADGTTVADEHTYAAHAGTGKTWGRCPDGTGSFVTTDSATPGAANDCPLPAGADGIKVNEIYSEGGDFIELTNVGPAAVDVSGWVLADNSEKRFRIPASSQVPAGGFLSFLTDDTTNPLGGFGLGNGDAARVLLADGTTVVDEHAYPAHAGAGKSWSRCADGVGSFIAAPISSGAANICPSPFNPLDVKLNEVESNGDVVADWVELTNTGATPADVSGWKLKDSGDSNPFVVLPADTIIQPGEFFASYTEFPPPGFGLGVDDTITLYQADGTSEVDAFTWSGGHAGTTYGRCADGVGDWQETTVSTRGTANACSPIRVNEIVSGDTDSVELVNLSNADIDVAGWVIKDSGDADPTTLPSPNTVPANGHLLVTALGAELDGADAVRLFDPTAKLIDSYSWTVHASPSYGRCKDGVGAFKTTAVVTPAAVNECPGLETEPWFGSQTVEVSDDAATFGQDASGVVFDPSDPTGKTLWVSQNKAGTLWKMTKSGNTWVPATGWTGGKNPRYNDGTGAPDSEGVTVGPDGAVYLATERNNAASGESKNVVLRYESGTSMNATDEWSLNSLLPSLGANLGLEGITWIPDTYLTEGGFVDQSTSAAYDPADYADHGDGLYAVAVEGTGLVYVVALEQTAAVQEQAHLVATIDPKLLTNAGPPGAMDVTWEPETERLWVVCDDSCDGVTVNMELDGEGAFEVANAYDRPLGMPNLNNEGLAFAPQTACADGRKEAVWTDDGDTGSHSLRSGTVPCTVIPVEPEPTEEPSPTTTPSPTTAPTTAPTTVPTTAPTTAPTKAPGSVAIVKAAKGKLRATAATKDKLVFKVTGSAGSPTGKFVVRLGGFDGTFTSKLNANGRLVIRVPELVRAGKRTLKITYVGDDLHPRVTRKFTLHVTH